MKKLRTLAASRRERCIAPLAAVLAFGAAVLAPVTDAAAQKANTQTTLTSSLNPSRVGQQIRIASIRAFGNGGPTGTVNFKNGGNSLGTSAVGAFASDLSFGVGAYHVCVLTDVGGVKCWGLNQYGALGNPTNAGTGEPQSRPA